MKRDRVLCCFIVLLFVIGAMWAQPPPRQIFLGSPLRLNTEQLQQRLNATLQRSSLSAATCQELTNNLAQLPPQAQQAAVALIDPATADNVGMPELAVRPALRTEILKRADPNLIIQALKLRVDRVAPEGGISPGSLGAAIGANFERGCIVRVNSSPASENYYWSRSILLFGVPASLSLGSTAQIAVYKPSTHETTSALSVRIVAPRGYRGVHGLRFPNFSEAVIPWEVYRFVFGASNVEFADGTHRPSAQAWYDAEFKGVGATGNCFGMSQLSLRTREFTHRGNTTALDHVMNGDWIRSTVTWGAWTLPWETRSKRAVQSLQGIQLVAPMLTHIRTQRASQDNKTAWAYARNMLSTQGPVQNTLFGHAVVTFGTEIDGNNRKFCFYDNNNPYAETDTDAPDPDHGVTNWTTGAFSYRGYTQTRCYDPHALTGQPLLPPGVGPSDSAEGAAADSARFELPRVSGIVITDESGRGGPDGVGVAGLEEIIPDMGWGPLPASFPRIFILRQATGRSLNFTIPNAGRQTRQIACFSRGALLLLTLNGASLRCQFSQLGQPNVQATLPDPAGSGLQQIRIIAPFAAEERQFEASNFSGLGATPLGVSLSADRSALELLHSAGAPPVNLQFQLRRFRSGGADTRPAIPHTLTGGQIHRLGPQNWTALGGALRIEQNPLPPNRLPLR